MKKNIIIAIILGAVSFLAYIFTMPASVYTGDSGEIATAIWSWGVSHPTGFPTYIILAKLFSYLLPWFEFAYRINIFSALCGAATVGIVFLISQKIPLNPPFSKGENSSLYKREAGRDFWPSIAASLSLAFGFTFWNHATLIETYGSTALFFALAIYIFLHWLEIHPVKSPDKSGVPEGQFNRVKKIGYLYLLAAVCGLGAGTHLTFFLFAPFALIFFVLKLMRKEIKINFIHLFFCFLVFLFSCSLIYSYIPLRAAAHPAMNWGDPSTKESFINYITQRDWSEKIGNRSFESWTLMLKELGKMFTREFTWLGLIFVLAGAAIAFKKQRIFFYAGLSVIFFNILLLGNYGNNQDIMILWRYFLPSYIMMTVFLGFSFSLCLPPSLQKRGWGRFSWGILFLILPAIIFFAHFGELNRHNNFLVQNATRDIFNSVPQGAILITSGDTLVGSTIYEQAVLGKRKDIILINDSLFTAPWYQKIKKEELENRGKKYADNISFLIRDNPDTEFFAVTNANSFLKMNYDFYSWGMAYKVLSKKDSVKLKDFMEKNETFWQGYDFGFLKDKKFAEEYFADEIVKIYISDLINLAAYMTNNGNVQAGIKYFEKSLAIRENKNALYNLAGIYNAMGDKIKALEYKARFDKIK